ncbi:MAG: aspartate aminotransferase family protein, partial [Myxococcales bacterium]|nr:aspartate aminotransferase family protein [Myxococcales bacterium]
MDDTDVLLQAARTAARYLEGFGGRRVGVRARYDQLYERLARPLPEAGEAASRVIDELARDVGDGLLHSAGPRFFGWVIGGTLPVAVAADWLTAAWDQNAALYQCSPAGAVVEEIAGTWLKELLGLPAACSFALVTGCQMAHFTALAAARERLLARRGVDVARVGLSGAPPLRVLTGAHRHESLLQAVRFLGLGTDAVEALPLDGDGRLLPAALSEALERDDRPTIVCLMAGDLNTGAADPFVAACELAHERGAWVHVDGAFGLWLNASDRHRDALAGVERADSWATDGHKWLNLPYDVGFVFVRDVEAHAAAMSTTASYFIAPDGAGRDPMRWNPEWSRRARGFVVYAALRALGRRGVAELVDRCCALAARLVTELAALPGVELISPARMNQGLVRFRDVDGDHDARTDAVIEAIQREGTAWFGGASWRGMRVMRVSVCSHRTR